ncbi:MAG: bifunctional (p)ppGpp synthetase/guanosine-3',5'-bis(diphosphate) 3'-pyrophosphohydrolase [Oscillospiraceae bacterium]|nr:bifunctional (p)ppGpp synthetase/guanosine-3',5'-bis(diphosphate) 3'-pyrophosphohydrolase [Oscillospiraceae bacterium]
MLNDYDDRSCSIDAMISKILMEDKQYDISKLITAYEFAKKSHEGQTRSSGEPYIKHPVAVASELLELGMDTDTLCAAFLHDVVEDTPVTLDDVRKRFGQDVALLVDGVTKLEKIPTFSQEQQVAENVMKILLAMSQDIRVMIIKLCDRLHNMRTLQYRPPHKQKRTALETMNIYAPIAHRLGITPVQEELEDRAFYYLDHYAYAEIEQMLNTKKEEREAFIATIKERIATRFKAEDFITPPQIEGRVKSVYGIYKKLYIGGKNFEEIYDKYAVRVIVTTVSECYNVLGLIHDMFHPIPNRFKDYIANPKQNMYQSLHTTVLGREKIPFEVQIRTWEMHANAEYGIAAHWKYKEGIQGKDRMEQRLAWIRQVIETQQNSDDPEELVNTIKNDIAPDEIVVMTPKGDSISLPVGATVIDFAYHIHTQIGHRTVGAKVNEKLVPLNTVLQTGNICEIITSKDENKGPNRNWLEIVKTNEARSKIRTWFKKERREENIVAGKAMLESEFRRTHLPLSVEQCFDLLAEEIRQKNHCETCDDLCAALGYGGISLTKLMPRIREQYQKRYGKQTQAQEETPDALLAEHLRRNKSSDGIILDEIENCALKFAQCCSPMPGDDVVGFITRGHGLSVHTKTCKNYESAVKRADSEELQRWVAVRWSDKLAPKEHQAAIEVLATSRVGLVYDICGVLHDARVPIIHSASRTLKNGNTVFEATVTVTTSEQLQNLLTKLRHVRDVISADRTIYG